MKIENLEDNSVVKSNKKKKIIITIILMIFISIPEQIKETLINSKNANK